jgi:5-(carboxyamino)imidazole ribonucleotide synthase
MSGPILPGSTVGVLGGGQLGRMFTLAARRMGYRVHVLSPDTDTPTGQVADVEVKAPYDDLDAVVYFAHRVQVVTFEFENIPSATVEAAARRVPVRPGGTVLHVAQNRLREKTFLAENGFPVAPFRRVESPAGVAEALGSFGGRGVLKTAGFGYDGKGQTELNGSGEVEAALAALGGREAVLESFVDYECELSVIGARGVDGSFGHYAVIRNDHRNHILDVSVCPAPVPDAVAREAVEIARGVMEALDVVGVLCVEFFLARDGRLYVNETAPRPHNSGHLTIDACVTSQFEQQLRAVCGLPLGSTAQPRPAAMANLLGDLWADGEPDWAAACAFPGVKLHLYGKSEARPGRKMGHMTAVADTVEEAANMVRRARAALTARPQPAAAR